MAPLGCYLGYTGLRAHRGTLAKPPGASIATHHGHLQAVSARHSRSAAAAELRSSCSGPNMHAVGSSSSGSSLHTAAAVAPAGPSALVCAAVVTAEAAAEPSTSAAADTAGDAAAEAPSSSRKEGTKGSKPGSGSRTGAGRGSGQRQSSGSSNHKGSGSGGRGRGRGRSSSGQQELDAPNKPKKPFLITITAANSSGAGSSSAAAAAAVVRRLRQRPDELIRVVATTNSALPRTLVTLLTANEKLQGAMKQMLMLQPTVIGPRSADSAVPQGAVAFYTSCLPTGAVLTDNQLAVHGDSSAQAVGKAIIARICTQGHTVLECFGLAGMAAAVKAVVQARKGLLVTARDVVMLLDTSVQEAPAAAADGDAAAEGDASTEEQASSSSTSSKAGKAAGASQQQRPQKAAAGRGRGRQQQGKKQQVVHNRIILLPCEPREPQQLLVRASMGRTDGRGRS